MAYGSGPRAGETSSNRRRVRPWERHPVEIESDATPGTIRRSPPLSADLSVVTGAGTDLPANLAAPACRRVHVGVGQALANERDDFRELARRDLLTRIRAPDGHDIGRGQDVIDRALLRTRGRRVDRRGRGTSQSQSTIPPFTPGCAMWMCACATVVSSPEYDSSNAISCASSSMSSRMLPRA
jgi:hypothetical protein